MGDVRMIHPETGAEITATPGQAAHYERSGWQTVEGEPEAWPAEAQLFGGQEQVRLRHPETGAEITVAASAVPFHRDKGWLVVTDEPAVGEAPPAPPEPTGGLDGLTVAELRELAKDQGISPIPTTKGELLEALSSQPRAAEPPATTEQAEQQPAAQTSEEEG